MHNSTGSSRGAKLLQEIDFINALFGLRDAFVIHIELPSCIEPSKLLRRQSFRPQPPFWLPIELPKASYPGGPVLPFSPRSLSSDLLRGPSFFIEETVGSFFLYTLILLEPESLYKPCPQSR